jgi:hypothetical protein
VQAPISFELCTGLEESNTFFFYSVTEISINGVVKTAPPFAEIKKDSC